jgi:SAM-dependent methyltransferase
MTDLDLIIDLHLRNDRQGPGGEAETRRALDLARVDARADPAIADLGCGTGASALLLSRWLDARVVAIDAAPAFVERLRERADREGLGDRIDARVGSMESPPIGEASLDLIWSEGAIYNMGFGAGVRAWRRFLRPGGVLAVSELTWTTAGRPAEVERHWTREYPGIATVSQNLRTLEREGYAPLGFFFLPRRCWEANYYAPLRAGFEACRRAAPHPRWRGRAHGLSGCACRPLVDRRCHAPGRWRACRRA